jgi:hypothetical protein
VQELIDASGGRAFQLLQDCWKRVRPAFFVSQRQKQEVYVIWHYYGCVEVVTFAVVMQAVGEDGVAGFRREGNSIGFAEGKE